MDNFINNIFPQNCGDSLLVLEKTDKKKENLIFWRNPYKHQEMKEKYIKLYDCGQLVFTWINS